MHFYGEVPYMMHEVTSGSGGYDYFFQLLPVTPNSPPYYAVGETSGEVFRNAFGFPINQSFHLAAGEVYTFLDHEAYVAANGDKLVLWVRVHLTINANGELVVERMDVFDFQCL
jgi:hypothetical protein